MYRALSRYTPLVLLLEMVLSNCSDTISKYDVNAGDCLQYIMRKMVPVVA